MLKGLHETIDANKEPLFLEKDWSVKGSLRNPKWFFYGMWRPLFRTFVFKGPLKCFETRSVILCDDFILTETGRQGGTYQAAPPLFKIANSVRLYHSLG